MKIYKLEFPGGGGGGGGCKTKTSHGESMDIFLELHNATKIVHVTRFRIAGFHCHAIEK